MNTPLEEQEELAGEFRATSGILASICVDIVSYESQQALAGKWRVDETGIRVLNHAWLSPQGLLDEALRKREKLSADLHVLRERQLRSWGEHGILTEE